MAHWTNPRGGMRLAGLGLLIALSPSLLAAAAADPEPKTEEPEAELRRMTQELLDAVAPGNAAVWERYLDPRVLYVSEDGTVLGKAELLAGFSPLPPGLVGSLRIRAFEVRQHGDTAVVTHEDDETLDYHGQRIASRYRSTDTWRRTADGWRLVAAQLLAVPDDPPAAPLPADKLAEYAGVYRLTPEIETVIRLDGGRLLARRTGRDEQELVREAPDLFFTPGQPRTRVLFRRGEDGAITGYVSRREGHDVAWKRERPGG